jgi:hypothetical protein
LFSVADSADRLEVEVRQVEVNWMKLQKLRSQQR